MINYILGVSEQKKKRLNTTDLEPTFVTTHSLQTAPSFGVKYRPHLQGRKTSQAKNQRWQVKVRRKDSHVLI
jgi:hypothetical protein